MRSVWKDLSRTSDERVAALMEAMTLEEKVAQLGGAWPGFSLRGEASEGSSGEVSPFQDSFEEVPWEQARVRGVGHLTRPYGTAPISVGDGARKLVGMQRDLMTETRLGVPAIAHEECLTGFTTFGATIYPAPLALAATFDPDLVESVAARIGSDLHRAGIHQGLSPVLDVVRDYRWGRVEETMGEDPYLCSVAGAAYVRGLEGEGVVATLKHFVGYSASRAARNHAPVSMGRRELLDVMLPPFEAAIREGGARSVMNSYTDIDGVPVAADETLLTGLLRESVGFRGVVVSDYWAVSLLANVHRVAAGEAEAGALALRAGIDVELPIARAYAAGLVELVRVGGLDEAIVDRALERVLTMKLELGLLDDGYDPAATVDPDLDLDSEANRLVAARAAEQAVVLLKNADLLPLTAAPRTIAVIGPAADEARSFLGCYSYPNHVLHRFPDVGIGVAAPTLLDAVRAEFPGSTVLHSAGCDFRGSDATGIDAAFEVASAADLVIVAVGDIAGLFGTGTSGEGCDAPDLTLPGVQDELLDRLLDAGTPTIVVCVSGRPVRAGAARGPCAGDPAGVHARPGRGRRHHRHPLGQGQPQRSAAGPGPRAALRAAVHLLAAVVRPAPTRCQLPLSPGPLPVRSRTDLHHVPVQRVPLQRGSDPHRRSGLGLGDCHQHREPPRRRGRPALPERPGRRGGPTHQHADRVRPRTAAAGRVRDGRVRRLDGSTCLPRSPRRAHRRRRRHRPVGRAFGAGHRVRDDRGGNRPDALGRVRPRTADSHIPHAGRRREPPATSTRARHPPCPPRDLAWPCSPTESAHPRTSFSMAPNSPLTLSIVLTASTGGPGRTR